MQNNELNTAKEYLKGHARQRRWRSIVAVLSCLVIICTAYILTQPATTMSTDTFCGMDEHTHSDACFEPVLICGECLPASHEHTSDCYEVQEVLACNQELNEDGTEHIHTAECYQEEMVLVCPYENSEETVPTEHVHSAECYARGELICQIPEHTHTLQCNSNPNAVESPEMWTAEIPALTGDAARDIVAIAESQLGYTESSENFRVNEDGSISGYTRYGAWYGGGNDSDFAYGDWCASFVSFCLNHAGISQNDFPYSAGCADWTQRLIASGLYAQADAYTPKAGDVVFLNMNGYGVDHVGIVTGMDESAIETIEGNLNGSVVRSSHIIGSSEILGYGFLPDGKQEDDSEQSDDEQINVASDAHETVQISVTTNESTYHDPTVDQDGALLYYTGESAVTTLNISNPSSSMIDDGAVVRLYMKFDKTVPETGIESEPGLPSVRLGEYTVTTASGKIYTYNVTEPKSGIYCFEVQRPLNGDTISIDLPSAYPSPNSAGGTNEVWGVILTKEEQEALDTEGEAGIAQKPADGSNQQTIRWETKPDDFKLSKEVYTRGSVVPGENCAYIKGQYWNIQLKRTGSTMEGKGKDYITSVQLSDTLALPDGIRLNEAVAEAIRSGDYSITYESSNRSYKTILTTNDGTQVLYFYADEMFKDDLQFFVTDDGNLKFSMNVNNSSVGIDGRPNKEFSNLSFSINIEDGIFEIPSPQAGKEYIFKNDVISTEQHTWSGKTSHKASKEAVVTVGNASMNLKKTSKAVSSYWGAPVDFSITATNPGVLTYQELGFIEDALPTDYYLDNEGYQSIFSCPGKATVTIRYMSLCQLPDKAAWKDSKGNAHTGGIDTGNSSPDTNSQKYNGKQSNDPSIVNDEVAITITKDDTGLAHITYLQEEITCPVEQIEDRLNALGFAVKSDTLYSISWDLRNEEGQAYSLIGGQTLSFDFTARLKNTFMRLQSDTEYAHPIASEGGGYKTAAQNYAYAYGVKAAEDGTTTKGKQIKSASSNSYNSYKTYPEVTFSKAANDADGSSLEQIPVDGATITYKLQAQFLGTKPDVLPLTDHMSGAQVLLAEVETNAQAPWASDCEIYTDAAGVEFYKLSNPGQYSGVWLNGYYADSVTVTQSAGGRDTLIKWYFSGSGEVNAQYKALVCPSEVAPNSLGYRIGNESWLNDHETHRLYAQMPDLDGTVFQFSKRIVSEADVTAVNKEIGADKSSIGEGEIVYYRIYFSPAKDGSKYTITGKSLRDELPLGLRQDGEDVFSWSISDSVTPGSVKILGYEGYESILNPDSYHIESGENEEQQYILWDDNFNITVAEQPVYMYIRLVFPSGMQWQKYSTKYGSAQLTNTFWVENVSDTVIHDLKNTAKAYLQKGVYYSNKYRKAYFWSYPFNSQQTDTLFMYENDSVTYGSVSYYAVLYNAGATRLYVQDLQDILPEGFTLKAIADISTIENSRNWAQSGIGQNTSSLVFTDPFVEMVSGEGNVTWVNFSLSASQNALNPQNLVFHIGEYQGTNGGPQIHYDSQLKLCYLEPGEGLNFGYICATNQRTETEDTSVNSIAMPYYDFNQSGVELSESSFVRKPRNNAPAYTPNDGKCALMDSTQAEAAGFVGGSGSTQWLQSEVTVQRGSIKPGITKELSSTKATSGAITEAPIVAAYPTDTLTWTVNADNDGSETIYDYVLSDTMQYPYQFAGSVKYSIVNSKKLVLGNGSLFSIHMNDENTAVLSPSSGGWGRKITVNGSPIQMSVYWDTGNAQSVGFHVRLLRDLETGNYTLSLRFQDDLFGIPSDCTGILSVETANVSNQLENRVFVNTCFLTPLEQVWDGTTNKGNITDLDAWGEGQQPAVRNSAPVTTSYGYTTGSLKSVFQTNDPSNATNSSRTPNYIVLPDRESGFTYTLSVENSDKALQSIVLIDGLPEVGDHSSFQTDDGRFSEFKVRLADELGLSVRVKTADGTLTELTPTQYTVEYSAKTDFDQSDWSGDSAWTETAAEARSLRIKIFDTTGTVIPAKAIISVSFNAVIDGDAAPGQIAWNSFGYHYSVVGSSAGLEAAPLKVGVMLPTVPKIQKSLIGSNGTSVAAENEAFRFICYTGSSLNLSDEKQLGESLGSNDRTATLIELDVPAGSSTSALTTLDNCVVYRYEGGNWYPTDEAWSWTSQAQYTLVELPNENSLYYFDHINKRTGAAGYSFYYRPGEQLILSVANRLDTWDFMIRKVDADDLSPLDGAWFALYSPEETDKISDEVFQTLMDRPNKKPSETIDHDGRTWYLAGIEKSRSQNGASGILAWDMLYRDEYVYCEVQAPQGHALDQTIHIARKDSQTHSVTITNEKSGYELPQTGGYGVVPFYLAGAILLLTSGGILFRKKKRG